MAEYAEQLRRLSSLGNQLNQGQCSPHGEMYRVRNECFPKKSNFVDRNRPFFCEHVINSAEVSRSLVIVELCYLDVQIDCHGSHTSENDPSWRGLKHSCNSLIRL